MSKTGKIKVFTTPRRVEGEVAYSESMFQLMKRNEELGFDGILLFENHSNDLEPWVFAQELFIRTQTQSPFIAVNPAYVHPYTAALKILSLTRLYKRRLYLNFITGTSKSDLESIGDHLTHSQRYDRLKEYIQIVKELLTGRDLLTCDGQYYRLSYVRLPVSIDPAFFPAFFISGASADATRVREDTGARKIVMAKPLAKFNGLNPNGICFGILARPDDQAAKNELASAFKPLYQEYKELLDISLENSDAVWKQELRREENDSTFFVEPFKHFVSDSPYLVGSYISVAEYICRYIELGIDNFIIEADDAELDNIAKVFAIVDERAN